MDSADLVQQTGSAAKPALTEGTRTSGREPRGSTPSAQESFVAGHLALGADVASLAVATLVMWSALRAGKELISGNLAQLWYVFYFVDFENV